MEFFQYLLVAVTDSLREEIQMQDLIQKGNHGFNPDLFLSFIPAFENLANLSALSLTFWRMFQYSFGDKSGWKF